MTKVNTNDLEIEYIPNATTITNESLDSFPNIKYFFETLVKDVPVRARHVGRSFYYSETVEKYRYYDIYAIFMQYFIYKHLSNQFNVETIRDRLAEKILENPDNYSILNEDCIYDNTKNLYESIKEHYEIYKDTKTKALDIITSIKLVSFSHSIYFRDRIPNKDFTVNENNLKEIIRYFKQLSYKTVALKPDLDCEYFNAFANLIFDNELICQIKTSKYQSLARDAGRIPLIKFYQNIIYAFGFYKQTGKMIKKFQIYNPLLGDVFTIELNNIDFELFEKVIKRDVTIWSRLMEIERKISLNLSLFEEEEEVEKEEEQKEEEGKNNCL